MVRFDKEYFIKNKIKLCFLFYLKNTILFDAISGSYCPKSHKR